MQLSIHPEAKGLIFDIDGTLIDSMPLHFKASQLAYSAEGFNCSKDLFLELAGTPTRKMVVLLNKRFGLDMDPEKIAFLKDKAVLDLIHELKPIEPVVDIVIKAFKKLPMALGTGGNKKIAHLNIRTIGLEKYFDAIVTGDDVKYPKPHPETFLKCAKLINIDPQFCQVFEDGELGIMAAKDAGMIVTDIRPFVKDYIQTY